MTLLLINTKLLSRLLHSFIRELKQCLDQQISQSTLRTQSRGNEKCVRNSEFVNVGGERSDLREVERKNLSSCMFLLFAYCMMLSQEGISRSISVMSVSRNPNRFSSINKKKNLRFFSFHFLLYQKM